MMKPILFSTPMVRAILAGRKTQTRRVIKVDNPDEWEAVNDCRIVNESDVPCYIVRRKGIEARGIHYPRFDVGDILWVRETWAHISDWADVDPEVGVFDGYIYKADWDGGEHPKWKPSIHMPKEAARLFLKVTNVRVEKLCKISLYDVWDEGTPQMPGNNDADGAVGHEDFIYLWDSINAKRGYGWQTNPWVWVYEFKRMESEVEG
jgi:hypothetical protein